MNWIRPAKRLAIYDQERCKARAEELARVGYERAGEPDGCYYCGSHQHATSDCHLDW